MGTPWPTLAATANVPAIDPDVDQARERSAVDLPSAVHPLIVAPVRQVQHDPPGLGVDLQDGHPEELMEGRAVDDGLIGGREIRKSVGFVGLSF